MLGLAAMLVVSVWLHGACYKCMQKPLCAATLLHLFENTTVGISPSAISRAHRVHSDALYVAHLTEQLLGMFIQRPEIKIKRGDVSASIRSPSTMLPRQSSLCTTKCERHTSVPQERSETFCTSII